MQQATLVPSQKARMIWAPATAQLVDMFPDAIVRRRPDDGSDWAALPHDAGSTIILRGHGYDCPAPIETQYHWPHAKGYTPFEAQVRTAALLTTSKRAFVLSGMGTGKTASTVWAVDHLQETGEAHRALIVAPLSTCRFVWAQDEIPAIRPDKKVIVLRGSAERKRKLLKEPADFYVINHDSLAIIERDVIARKDIDCIVIDELSVYKNARSSRTKAAARVCAGKKWVWGLTGSPCPNSPTEVYGQCKVVTPDNPQTAMSFKRFESEMMMSVGPGGFRKVAKAGAEERAVACMTPSIRFSIDDIKELPPIVERLQSIPLGTKQERIYERMRQEAVALVDEGEVTAANAGVVLGKLLQISCGYVYARDADDPSVQRIVTLDNEDRLEAVVQAVREADRKVIVFAPFVHTVDGVANKLREEGIDVAVVDGRVSESKRLAIFTAFQETARYKVIVAHPRCMAHGLTLTAANVVLWFGPTSDVELFEQANARIRRPSQEHKQLILMFSTTKAETRMFQALKRKQKFQSNVLELFAARD